MKFHNDVEPKHAKKHKNKHLQAGELNFASRRTKNTIFYFLIYEIYTFWHSYMKSGS